MARSPAQIQSEIDGLRKMRSAGTQSVTYMGRTVVFRSMTELNQALRQLGEELAEAEGAASGPQRTRRYAVFSDGYHDGKRGS